MTDAVPKRSAAWKWYVCALLGLATTINYLDRQTLSTVSKRIIDEFQLTNEQYGRLELGFGLAFAVGTSTFGFIADRTSIRWLYPGVLVLWSMMGFFTGLVESYAGLLLCRTLLGLFEAGHWPCALKTTQWLLKPKDRTMGNSILQNGTSIASIATPLLMMATLTPQPGSWRPLFQIIGLVGIIWALVWLLSVRASDLPLAEADCERPAGPLGKTPHDDAGADASFLSVVLSRRFAVLVAIVVGINVCWQILRAWLPLYLQKSLGYSESRAFLLTSLYFAATGAGCICAGVATLRLHRSGMSAGRARVLVFFCCALLTTLAGLLPYLPDPGKVAALMAIGFGALGLFPCYYAITQELTVRHQGKLAGVLGSLAWIVSSPLQPAFGWLVDVTHSYDLGLTLAGEAPLLSFCVLYLFWGAEPAAQRESQPVETVECVADAASP
jgi:ACS family hexuronate transporter-like MFS transporter